MRTVKYASRFKRDYRREKSGHHGRRLDALLMEVVDLLASDKPLPRRNFDHTRAGEWNGHRDCHVRPDLVLIYRKPTMRASSWYKSGRTASLAYDPWLRACIHRRAERRVWRSGCAVFKSFARNVEV